MLRILDPPMTPNRLGQALGIGFEAADEVPDLHRLPSFSLHHREDITHTPEVTPGRAMAQLLGDRRGDVGPILPPYLNSAPLPFPPRVRRVAVEPDGQ